MSGYLNTFTGFGQQPSLADRINHTVGGRLQNEGQSIQNNAAIEDMNRKNTLRSLYSQAVVDKDPNAMNQIAGVDPVFHQQLQKGMAEMDKAQRDQMYEQLAGAGRKAMYAKQNPQLWRQVFPNVPYEKADEIIAQSMAVEDVYKSFTDQQTKLDDRAWDQTKFGETMRHNRATEDISRNSKGMSLEVGDDGTFSFSQGGYGNPRMNGDYSKKYYQEAAKADVELDSGITSGIDQTQQGRYTVARLNALLNEGTKTGAAEPYKYAVSKWLQSAGVNVDITNQEEMNRLSRQMAFEELAKFKGATSEKELDFALNLVGNLGSDPTALKRYLLVTDVVFQRNEKIAQLRNNYVRDNGSVKGFRYAMDQWKLDNPLVAQPKAEEDFQSMPIGSVYVDPDDGKLYLKK